MKRIGSIALVLFIAGFIAGCSPSARTGNTAPDTAEKTAAAAGETSGGKTVPLDMGKEDNTRLTVASSKPEDRFLETAVAAFRKKNPGIVVEIKHYTAMGETYTRETEDGSMLMIGENTDPGGEKYIKTISTELMSGAGPDIIDTFYLPFGKFADNGFLCDMEAIIAEDAGFDGSSYYENILDAVKYKGGLYTMPLGFLADYTAGKYSLPEGTGSEATMLDDFLKTAGETLKTHGINGTYVLSRRDTDIFDILFRSRYGSFVKEDTRECDFTSGEFVELIKQIKEAADEKLIFRAGEDVTRYKGWEDLYFIIQSSYDSNYLAYYKNPKGENNVYAIPYLDKPGIGSDIFMEYGINSNSKSKGAAWKFIKFIISEEMQTSPEFFPFPINKAAMQKKIERERVPEAGTELTAGDSVFSRLTVYPKKNWQVLKIVQEETEKFFDGQRSAEDTANIIQGRINVMIKE